MKKKTNSRSPFLEIPGVGKSIAKDLEDLGFRNIDELKKANPEKMYQKLCEIRGERIDRCLLYVFRCACEYAKEGRNKNLKWWSFKDKKEKI
ncbi:MAG: helix-hairpin-helix domain-containing protein [Acidobacteria bacterium]|nr:helix-hairpin-helix domain-containing protein [Acidobacteriota bacterium]